MAKQTTLPSVAVDDGYAQIKVYGVDGAGNRVRHRFRSSIRSGRDGLGMVGGEGAFNAYKTEEGEEFTVSEGVAGESTQFDGFHTSPMNRVLVLHGVREAGFSGDVDLIVGLPVADYFAGGVLNRDRIAAKKGNLGRGVTFEVGSSESALPRFASIDVRCQAVSAYIDYAVDDDLNDRAGEGGSVAVVDIGGRTTDIAVVVNGQTVDFNQSGTANAGVLDVYRSLSDRIKAEFGTKSELPLTLLDKAVRTGAVRLFGKEHPVEELVKASVTEIQGKIRREIERKIKDGAALEAVVFVGGGGNLFTEVHRDFEHGRIADDPEFANARGMWKLRELRKLAEQAKAA